MNPKKNILRSFARASQMLVTGQFSNIISTIARNRQSQISLTQRRKSLRAHGIAVTNHVAVISKRFGVRPHLTFGTLLGYRRDKGFIRDDYDLDFGLLSSDRPNVPGFVKAMQNAGFELKLDSRLLGPLSVIGEYSELSFTYRNTGLTLDFYFYHPWNNEMIYAADTRLNYFHARLLEFTPIPKDQLLGYALSYPGNMAKNFTEVNFLGADVLVPTDTDAYLERLYGDWQIPQKNFFYKNVYAIVPKSSKPGIELIRLPAPSAKN